MIAASVSQPQVGIAFPRFSFERPVDIQHPPDGSGRIFVVEQPGKIFVFKNHRDVQEKKLFLDLSGTVDYGGEKGLLGLAFHPEFPDSGFFTVNYTRPNPLRTLTGKMLLLR